MDNEKTKKSKKILKIVLISFGALILVLGLTLFLVRDYFINSVHDYYEISEKAFEIPNLNNNFVPQGLTFDNNTEKFLTCGYDSNGAPSKIVLVDIEEEKNITLNIKDQNGDDFFGHLGGCEINGNYLYITGDENASLYVLDYEEVKNAKSGDSVHIIGSFGSVEDKNYLSTAFVTKRGNKLIIGEFYKTPEYETEETHKITTKNGDYNQALAFVFELDESAEFGISKEIKEVWSLPDKAQGMTFDGDNIYISTSWGLSFSKILIYDNANIQKQDDIKLYGTDYPLYALDSASLKDEIKLAPMSEEMVIVNSKLYIMSESASNKYIFGKVTGGNYCYAIKLDNK